MTKKQLEALAKARKALALRNKGFGPAVHMPAKPKADTPLSALRAFSYAVNHPSWTQTQHGAVLKAQRVAVKALKTGADPVVTLARLAKIAGVGRGPTSSKTEVKLRQLVAEHTTATVAVAKPKAAKPKAAKPKAKVTTAVEVIDHIVTSKDSDNEYNMPADFVAPTTNDLVIGVVKTDAPGVELSHRYSVLGAKWIIGGPCYVRFAPMAGYARAPGLEGDSLEGKLSRDNKIAVAGLPGIEFELQRYDAQGNPV